jgi:two-component system response regulator YesN
MNVLIVDDDRFIVGALAAKIDWESLSVEHVYQAFNIRQAQKIFEEQVIHILISDIRMPQGSGLDLLSWVRERDNDVEAIFLTNYAQFHYAQKALELQSLDFFLKPVAFDKLYPVLKKAVERIQTKRGSLLNQKTARQVEENKARLKDHFWQQLLTGVLKGPQEVGAAAQESLLACGSTDCFLPVMIRVFEVPGCAGEQQAIAFAHRLPDVFEQTVGQLPVRLEHIAGSVFPKCVVLIADLKSRVSGEELQKRFCSLINRLRDSCGMEFECLIGYPAALSDLSDLVGKMRQDSMFRLDGRGLTALYHGSPNPAEYTPPGMEELSAALSSMDIPRIHQCIAECMHELECQVGWHVPAFRAFRLDFTQMVFSFLHGKGIEAHRLFEGEEFVRLEQNSMESSEDLRCYLANLVNRAVMQVRSTGLPDSVAGALVQYIADNLDKDLSRSELAGHVFMNADYMSRLFKQETGIPMGQYIRDKRIEEAKKHLESSGDSIHEIAGKVGYSNYSLFTKTFREVTGQTPMEYRKNLQGK